MVLSLTAKARIKVRNYLKEPDIKLKPNRALVDLTPNRGTGRYSASHVEELKNLFHRNPSMSRAREECRLPQSYLETKLALTRGPPDSDSRVLVLKMCDIRPSLALEFLYLWPRTQV